MTTAKKWRHKRKRNLKVSKLQLNRPTNTLCKKATFCLVDREHTTPCISAPRGVSKRIAFDSQAETATQVDDGLQAERPDYDNNRFHA